MDTNISNALKIVAGMLFATMVIALLTYFWQSLTRLQREVDFQQSAEQLAAFNQEYLVYDKNLMYGVDVLSAINKAASNNKMFTSEGYAKNAELRENYLVNVEIVLKTDVTESMQLYRLVPRRRATADDEAVEEVIEDRISTLDDIREVLDDDSLEYNDIEDSYMKSCYTEETWDALKSAVKEGNEHISLEGTDAGISYQLVPEHPDPGHDDEWINETLRSELVNKSTNMKIVLKNIDKNADGDTKTDVWSKAEILTSVYNFKKFKFKCTQIGYSSTTGRINYMKFEQFNAN